MIKIDPKLREIDNISNSSLKPIRFCLDSGLEILKLSNSFTIPQKGDDQFKTACE